MTRVFWYARNMADLSMFWIRRAWKYVVECCSVLKCVAVCCSVCGNVLPPKLLSAHTNTIFLFEKYPEKRILWVHTYYRLPLCVQIINFCRYELTYAHIIGKKNTTNVCVFRTLKFCGLWLLAEGDSMFCLFALHRQGHAYDLIGLCRQQLFSAKERSASLRKREALLCEREKRVFWTISV